jgi:hypothetical protein
MWGPKAIVITAITIHFIFFFSMNKKEYIYKSEKPEEQQQNKPQWTKTKRAANSPKKQKSNHTPRVARQQNTTPDPTTATDYQLQKLPN